MFRAFVKKKRTWCISFVNNKTCPTYVKQNLAFYTSQSTHFILKFLLKSIAKKKNILIMLITFIIFFKLSDFLFLKEYERQMANKVSFQFYLSFVSIISLLVLFWYFYLKLIWLLLYFFKPIIFPFHGFKKWQMSLSKKLFTIKINLQVKSDRALKKWHFEFQFDTW